jgi:hypothetical protein
MKHDYEQYKHHGNLVWVETDMKGTHRDICLCWNCTKLNPGLPGNCPIAQRLFELDVEFKLVTPVLECPEFEAINE